MRTRITRDEDHELLGFVVKGTAGWEAQTIFGYLIERTTTKEEAVAIIRERGLGFLMGIWQYFDKDEKDWFPCVIKEAGEHRVTIIRTNVMGYQDPDDYKLVVLTNPSENSLIKAS